MSTDLKLKAMYYAFGRNDAVGGVPFVDPGEFSAAFATWYEQTGHIVNVQTAFDRFKNGKPVGEG